jgi:hypothetical protein
VPWAARLRRLFRCHCLEGEVRLTLASCELAAVHSTRLRIPVMTRAFFHAQSSQTRVAPGSSTPSESCPSGVVAEYTESVSIIQCTQKDKGHYPLQLNLLIGSACDIIGPIMVDQPSVIVYKAQEPPSSGFFNGCVPLLRYCHKVIGVVSRTGIDIVHIGSRKEGTCTQCSCPSEVSDAICPSDTLVF